MLRVTAVIAFVLATSASVNSGEPDPKQVDFFEKKIRPVLIEHCYRCHSEESGKSKGSLHLDSKQGWEIGGDSGPAIVPGDPGESLLVDAISRSGLISEMPPTSHLPDAVVEDFRQWIINGAVDPRTTAKPSAQKPSIDIEAGREFWSFQPRRSFEPAKSVDDFVSPSSPIAPPDSLVRRIYLDLIGLPPSPAESDAFRDACHSQSSEVAISNLVDELLGRQAFGEKWARHWLDVARYADSNGGDFNLTFHEAWRYRNYVIAAFNEDMPYDQFLREQIAGDLLDWETAEQRNRQLIATGFLMVSPKMLTERNKPKMHLDIADEQVDTIGRAIMGLTLGCARCHDHKFDPIPTADYYALAGILHSTRTAEGILMDNVNVSGWLETDLAFDTATQQLVDQNKAQLSELETEIKGKKAEAEKLPSIDKSIVVDDTEAEKTGPWRKSTYRPNHIGKHYLATDKGKNHFSITWKAKIEEPCEYELQVSFGGGSGLEKKARYEIEHLDGPTLKVIDQSVTPTIDGLWHPIGRFRFQSQVVVTLTNEMATGHVIADAIRLVSISDQQQSKEAEDPKTKLLAEIKKLEGAAQKLRDSTPEIAKAMAAQDLANERFGDLHIRVRGEAANLGRIAPRGFLQVIRFPGLSTPQIASNESGRRELAEWISHPDHPLTARVMANRIWTQLFGRGLVETTDNFGTRGSVPAQRELLDHLANAYVSSGWSTKSLIRRIVTSRTYLQAARAPSDSDPYNELLLHQNRRPQSAESMRDSMLAISGLLDSTPRNSVVKQLGMYAIQTSGKRHESLARTDQLRQRSIYLPIVRGAVPPSLALFDLPNPDLVTGARAETTVPAQALFMMNSDFVREVATALSKKIVRMAESDEEAINQLYRRILIRDASHQDVLAASDYLATRIENGTSNQEAIASLAQVLFSSTEFRFID